VRVLTVVGARPQFVKHGAVARVLRRSHEEYLVHTGQHHDHGMSARFFEELDIPAPDANLGIAGGPHGQMTGRMLEAIEALVGAKLHVPVAHVEAGLRSFNRRMPEEVNRVVTDHVSSLLLCPTENAVRLLAAEGITRGVHRVGDVMLDSVRAHVARARSRPEARRVGPEGPYALATVHRPENTDHPARLGAILEALSDLSLPVVLPLHPRTRKVIEADAGLKAKLGPGVRLVEPLGYLDLLATAADAALVLTDSGGLQKEALFVGARCVTLRDETEWVETVESGANELVGADAARIRTAAARALAAGPLPAPEADGPFGDGRAAEKIVALLPSALEAPGLSG
jgi:UDP-GlcNAc3NAcA epimerase